MCDTETNLSELNLVCTKCGEDAPYLIRGVCTGCINGEAVKSLKAENKIYINTDGMRKTAQSIKDGQGTREGSMAKMLIDCCDLIDELRDENEGLKAILKEYRTCELCKHGQETVFVRDEKWRKYCEVCESGSPENNWEYDEQALIKWLEFLKGDQP